MILKLKELKMVKFISKNRKEVDKIQKTFVKLFNQCGKKFNDSSMQLALTGSLMGMMLKNTNIENKEIQKLLKNLSKKFK